MSLIALTAAKSSGVTTSALALAGLWPTPVLLAECDPAGGDITAGLLRGALPAGGLLDLALATRCGLSQEQFWDHTTALSDDGTVRLLAGLADPAQSAAVRPAWPLLIQMLHALTLPTSTREDGANEPGPLDVLADCGRLGADTPAELIAGADLVLLVLRPCLSQVAHTRTRLTCLRGRLGELADGPPPEQGLLIVGAGPYTPSEITAALDLPVLGVLADDPWSAAVLSGLADRPARFERSPLMRSARTVAADVYQAARAAADPAANTDGGTSEGASDQSAMLAMQP